MRRTKIALVAASAAGALSACGDGAAIDPPVTAVELRERPAGALNSRDIIP